MINDFLEVFSILNIQVYLISILLFFIGYAAAPAVYFKKINWLTAYPFFIVKIIDKHFNKDWHPVKIFGVIFTLNSLSLFINLISAYGVILPVLFSIYLGLNLGIIMFHTLEGKFYYLSLLNPVAILELPATWISFTMAIQFSTVKYFNVGGIEQISINQYMVYFYQTVLPILFIAGLIETVLIVVARKFDKNESQE